MRKTFKIIMLPTSRNNKGIVKQYNKLELFDCQIREEHAKKGFDKNKIGCLLPQHLYILSDEEIKENDWFIGEENSIIHASKEVYDDLYSVLNDANYSICWRSKGKIIASTDKSLNLPGIPQSYLKYYISEYNKGNVIKEIELEIENVWKRNTKRSTPTKDDIDERIKLQNNKIVPVIDKYKSIKENFLNKDVWLKSDWEHLDKNTYLGKVIDFYLGTDEWLYCITNLKHQIRYTELTILKPKSEILL